MSRSRNIKPSFFQNEHLAETSTYARLLFIGLWCLADREGRLEDRPKRIKANLFPYEDVDADKLLTELTTSKGEFIIRYKTEDDCYIQIVNFLKHQSPHIKEAPSNIPAPCQHPASTLLTPDTTKKDYDNKSGTIKDTISTRQTPDKHQTSTSEESLIPDSLNLIPDSRFPHTDSLKLSPIDIEQNFENLFNTFWNEYPKKVNKIASRKAFFKLKPTDDLFTVIIQAVKDQKQTEEWLNNGGQFIPNPDKWLRNGRWEDEVKNNGHRKLDRHDPNYYTSGRYGHVVKRK